MNFVLNISILFHSANLPMPYLNNVAYCDPLGDQNVWGTMFQLKAPVKDIIMLATKVQYTSGDSSEMCTCTDRTTNTVEIKPYILYSA